MCMFLQTFPPIFFILSKTVALNIWIEDFDKFLSYIEVTFKYFDKRKKQYKI